jgi:hypothetical protein
MKPARRARFAEGGSQGIQQIFFEENKELISHQPPPARQNP